jgi:hypothetical protein
MTSNNTYAAAMGMPKKLTNAQPTATRVGARNSAADIKRIHALRDNAIGAYRQACELCGCAQCEADLSRINAAPSGEQQQQPQVNHVDHATTGSRNPGADHNTGNSKITDLTAQRRVSDALLAGNAPSTTDLSQLSEEERWKVLAEVARNSGNAQLQQAVAALMIATQRTYVHRSE